MSTLLNTATFPLTQLFPRLQQLLQRLAAKKDAQRPTAAARSRMERGATVWVARPLGHLITCEAGALWLTFDGEPVDLVLEAGQSHLCTRASRLGVTALTHATLHTCESRCGSGR